jgi:AmiR/NasT family two-component response regulator
LSCFAQVVAGLGHEVIAREVDVTAVGAVTAREQPNVALVGLGLSSDHALELIEQIVRESSCPVIALLSAEDPAYVREAAKRGVFAYLVDTTPVELQSAIDVTLQRFTEYHNLQGAFGRRAVIEQAKGILMARHTIDATRAFEMLREHSQHSGQKLANVAAADGRGGFGRVRPQQSRSEQADRNNLLIDMNAQLGSRRSRYLSDNDRNRNCVGHHHRHRPCRRRRHARGEERPRDRVHHGGRRRADHRNRG